MESAVDADVLSTRARVQWPACLAVVHAARRWQAAQGGPSAGAPREPSCPIGRLQGYGTGAQRDASGSQVATMWSVVQRPEAHRVRDGFMQHLERWLEETTPREEPDWGAARAAGERWSAWAAREPEHAAVLALVAGELAPGASWESAALVAAEQAPRELRALWALDAALPRAPGRPRRDVTAAPVGVSRLAWGEARLTGAVLAWAGGA